MRDERAAVEAQLVACLKAEAGEIARDMATHVGEQIFDVLKRHGLMMRSEAGATAMLTLSAVRLLTQAADQCSRAAEEDCTGAVARLFRECLPDNLRAHLAGTDETGRGEV